METIHVKFDELTAIASEHDCLEPELQRFNNQNSSDDLMNTPSKEDLDNLFGLMFKDYFEQKSSDTTINSAAQPTHDQEDSPSTSSIIVDTHEAPPVVTTSDEQTSPISLKRTSKKLWPIIVGLSPNQFERLQVWELVPRPEGKNVIALKWLWKNKCDADNIVVRNKSRLVAKGYKQEEGIDFEESFAHVVVLRLFKMFIAFVLISEYHYLSMDVKRLFSYGPLKEEVYFIIMAQQQHAADVHPDELCPPNKRYDLMDANKKVDLEHVQCPSRQDYDEYIKNHPFRFSIAAY
ncbi:retrovirus-related pol polyprotein from transposon TNT 1-94 [Tanacetum coccineum]